MGKVSETLSELVRNIIAFVVMIVMAIVAFYFTVFVVATGAGFAGMTASGDFVVLSASLLVAAAILAGGVSPVGYLSQPMKTNPTQVTSADD